MEAENRRHDFSLLPEDEAFLNASSYNWETVKDGTEQLLIIKLFPIPDGYNIRTATVICTIPLNYPQIQIDMFYVYPALAIVGKKINNTEATKTFAGVVYQRWSRHRTQINPWRPGLDNIHTHVALIEELLLREVKHD